MNIIMILYQYFISDTRVQREASFLTKKGFKIEIINLKKPNKKSEKNKDNRILNSEIMEIDSKERQTLFGLLKFWLLSFLHLIKLKNIPKIIHAHDLTGLPPAVLYKIIFPKVKIIYDSHELFPEAAKDKLNNVSGLAFLYFEKFLGKFINLLIGSSPMQLKILGERINKPQYCILNVPDLEMIMKKINIENLSPHPLIYDMPRKVKVVYSGGVYPYRGYDEFVKSASYMLKKSSNFEFWIVGDGIYLKKVKELVKKHNLIDHFRFTGAVPFIELLKLTYSCDIAVGLYEDIKNNNIMISNKIFEYMLVGIPFLFTNLKSSQPYLKMVKAIKIDFPLDPEKIAEKILYLANNENLQCEISKKSKSLIMEKLNWKNESAKLAAAYKELLNKK